MLSVSKKDGNVFTLSLTNDKIWNLVEFVGYLNQHQHQDIEIRVNPEAISLESASVYEILDQFTFNSVKIYTHNLLENHPTYEIVKTWYSKWFDYKPKSDTLLHTWNMKKIFLTMFRRPSANRLGLASYLYANYADHSHIHFSYQNNIDTITEFEFDKLASYDQNSLQNVSQLLSKLPLLLYSGGSEHYNQANDRNFDPKENSILYPDIFVDIVSESHVMGNTFYATEKTSRPMRLKKPFIIFASRDYLDYLHQMGFLTFGDFWSENYDGYEGRDRYLMILELIDSLAAKPKNELFAMYQDMQYILDHNYNLFVTQQYKTSIQKIQ